MCAMIIIYASMCDLSLYELSVIEDLDLHS